MATPTWVFESGSILLYLADKFGQLTPTDPAQRADRYEAVRRDEQFSHAAVWEFQGVGQTPKRHVEPMKFENVKLATRSYK